MVCTREKASSKSAACASPASCMTAAVLALGIMPPPPLPVLSALPIFGSLLLGSSAASDIWLGATRDRRRCQTTYPL